MGGPSAPSTCSPSLGFCGSESQPGHRLSRSASGPPQHAGGGPPRSSSVLRCGRSSLSCREGRPSHHSTPGTRVTHLIALSFHSSLNTRHDGVNLAILGRKRSVVDDERVVTHCLGLQGHRLVLKCSISIKLSLSGNCNRYT